MTPSLILASGSPYRRELLTRLGVSFEVLVPAIDERPLDDELPAATAQRLACVKARHVAGLRPQAIVIGSDQVAECAGRRLGKPGSRDAAIAQLSTCSGHALTLHTAVHISVPGQAAGLDHLDRTVLRFRSLSAEQIARYVDRDRPFDCAGGFKFESAGCALFSEVRTADPTAIQGLPLLWLSAALNGLGFRIP